MTCYPVPGSRMLTQAPRVGRVMLGFVSLCSFALGPVDAFGGGWILIQAPIKLGTKSPRTTYDDSLPLKNWNIVAIADSEASCRSKMVEKERQDQEIWEGGLKVAAQTMKMSEDEVKARVPRIPIPRMCLPDNDPRLR